MKVDHPQHQMPWQHCYGECWEYPDPAGRSGLIMRETLEEHSVPTNQIARHMPHEISKE